MSLPYTLMSVSGWPSLLKLRVSCSSGECSRLRVWGVSDPTLPVADRFGLYEQSCACSRLTQLSQGLLLSHFTLRCLHGQQAVPGSSVSVRTSSRPTGG